MFKCLSCVMLTLLSAPFLIANCAEGQEKTTTERVTPRSPVATASSGVFFQQVRTNYGIDEGLPSGGVNCLAVDQNVYAATQKGIAAFDNGRWRMIHGAVTPVKVLAAARQKVWFIRDNQVFEMVDASTSKSVAQAPSQAILTTLLPTQDSLLIGTSKGLFVLREGNIAAVRQVNELLGLELDIRHIAIFQDEVAIAAEGGLLSYNLSSKRAVTLTPRNKYVGWALQDVRGVGFDSEGHLWFAAPQGVGERTADAWNLYTGYEGLPYNDFTCLATGRSNDVWFGTRKGAVHFTGRQWEYREGKRWLGDDVVNSVVVTANGATWFATPAGVTQIEPHRMTLRDKAAFFNEEIDKYHRRTPFGYVDAIHLETAGDKSKGMQYDSDNDGLWTSMYGAGECFEYAVTKSAPSKKRADNAFRAIAFLSEVPQGGKQSPPFGFPARTILPTSGRNPNDHDNAENDQRHQQNDPLWKVITPRWPISADGKWYWKADTSSDELDGHYFFYALYYDLVAETDQEKRDVRAVVNRITMHLLEHDYALIDHDGKPTRWGRFGPSVLNTDVLTDCRGMNSISILSYLLTAEHILQ